MKLEQNIKDAVRDRFEAIIQEEARNAQARVLFRTNELCRNIKFDYKQQYDSANCETKIIITISDVDAVRI